MNRDRSQVLGSLTQTRKKYSVLYCIVLYGQAEHKPEGVPVPIVYFIIYGFVFVTVLNSPKPASPHQPEKRVTLWAAQIAGFTSLLVLNIG